MVELLFLTPKSVPRESLCDLPHRPEDGRAPQHRSVWSGRVPPPRTRGDKFLQVLAEVSPGWRPWRAPTIRGILCLVFSPLLPAQPPRPGWALTSPPAVQRDNAGGGGQRGILSPQHPPPRGHFPGLFCSARTGAGCPRGRTSLTCRRYFTRRQSRSGARDDGRERLSHLSGLSPGAFPPRLR